jgi:putative membrane protein
MTPSGLPITGAQSSGSDLIGQPYCGQFVPQTAWYLQFNLDLLVIGALAIAGFWASLARPQERRFRIGAVLVAAVLWLSPFCPASATLLSLRAVHHLAVMLVLAPILALGWRVAFDPRASGHRASLWALASAASFAVWFWPPAYSAAWQSDAIYWALQLAMLAAATAFWRSLFVLARSGLALAIVPACAIASAAMGAVGAVLTFAPQVLLAEHQITTMALRIAPLADQQLAGLVIWVFGMLPVAGYALRAGWQSLVRAEEAAV